MTVMNGLALKGHVVIVGRGSQVILRDRPTRCTFASRRRSPFASSASPNATGSRRRRKSAWRRATGARRLPPQVLQGQSGRSRPLRHHGQHRPRITSRRAGSSSPLSLQSCRPPDEERVGGWPETGHRDWRCRGGLPHRRHTGRLYRRTPRRASTYAAMEARTSALPTSTSRSRTGP